MPLFGPISVRAIPPNAITAAAMASGIASVYISSSGGSLYWAAWLVLLSTLLDKADGSVARLIKGSSEFGVQFDSLADNIAFGLAPAALIFAAAQRLSPLAWGEGVRLFGFSAVGVLACICLTYAILTSVRLARFNVMTADLGPSLFLGLPSTLSGGLICSAFLTLDELHLGSPSLYQLFPWLLALNAALMVSNLPLPKLHISAHPIAKWLQILAGVLVYASVLARMGFAFVLLLLLGYLALGFIWLGPRMWRDRMLVIAQEKGSGPA